MEIVSEGAGAEEIAEPSGSTSGTYMAYLGSMNGILRRSRGAVPFTIFFRAYGRTAAKRRLGVPAPSGNELLNRNAEKVVVVCAHRSKTNHSPFRRFYKTATASNFRGRWKVPRKGQDHWRNVAIWV